MPDSIPIMREAWEVAKYILVAAAAMLGWNMKRMVEKVDALEKESVSKDSFNNTVQALRNDFKDAKKEIKADIDKIHARIDRK